MSRLRPGEHFRFTRSGVKVSFGAAERKALAEVVEQFRHLLFSGSDPNLTRLEPVACPDDPEVESEYQAMAAIRLLRHRLEAIDVVEAGLEGATLDADGVAAWMKTLNGIRLYLGERLEIFEGHEEVPPDHTDIALVPIYDWLGGLLEQLVGAAAKGLPPPDGTD